MKDSADRNPVDWGMESGIGVTKDSQFKLNRCPAVTARMIRHALLERCDQKPVDCAGLSPPFVKISLRLCQAFHRQAFLFSFLHRHLLALLSLWLAAAYKINMQSP